VDTTLLALTAVFQTTVDMDAKLTTALLALPGVFQATVDAVMSAKLSTEVAYSR